MRTFIILSMLLLSFGSIIGQEANSKAASKALKQEQRAAAKLEKQQSKAAKNTSKERRAELEEKREELAPKHLSGDRYKFRYKEHQSKDYHKDSLYTDHSTKKYREGDRLFDRLWYAEAARWYENKIEKGDESQAVLERIADAYYFNTDMVKANAWYQELFDNYEAQLYPKHLWRYIHSLKGVGDYEKATSVMKRYSERLDVSSTGINVAQFGDNSAKIKTIQTKGLDFYIKNVSINQRYADFAPMFFGDKVVFASSRDTIATHTRIYHWNEQPFLDLYIADTDTAGINMTDAKKFSCKLNTKYHEAGVSFTPSLDTIYFTRNNYTKKLKRDKDGMNHLKLYRATAKDYYKTITSNEKIDFDDFDWRNVAELPFNSNSYSVGHPAVSPDGKQLYFVSDMPGTIGGTDIFVVDILEDGGYSEPKNLGETINTSGREMFPFATAEKLYFASDGHLGLGALDIFESTRNHGNYSIPNNPGKPLNSELDDFAYIVDEETQRGYFSSNRLSGKGDDDIYSFERTITPCTRTVVGTAIDKNTRQLLSGVTVSIYDAVNKELQQSITSSDGTFNFKADCSSNEYRALGTKTKYTDGEETFIFSEDVALELALDLALTPIPEPISTPVVVVTTPKYKLGDDLMKVLNLNPINFDYDKSFIRSDAAYELDKIVSVMKEYPNMVIKIQSHTDSRGRDSYNASLSDRRAKSTRDYIVQQGISSYRIQSAIGYGESILINHCSNGVKCADEVHEQNRRSEFIIVTI